MKYNKNQRGETLIEVITALTALVMAGVAAVTVILSVMQANAISKEYLIAQNLAREGIEGVITIRNTNWLRFPSTKGTDWLCINVDATTKTCLGRIIPASSYILNRDVSKPNEGFFLEAKAGDLNLSDGVLDNLFELGLQQSGDLKLYTHGTSTVVSNPKFYRMIKFDVLTADSYKVTVTIQWLNKSQVSEYKLTSIITNYAK